jgi:hypothetical protein
LLTQVIVGVVAVVIGAMLGFLGGQLRVYLNRRIERKQVVAALLFELNSNLRFAERVGTSRNYLRDEAWIDLKRKGYVSYLAAPLPSKIADVYERLHTLNQQTHDIRDALAAGREIQSMSAPLQQRVAEFRSCVSDLVTAIGKRKEYRQFIVSNELAPQQRATLGAAPSPPDN